MSAQHWHYRLDDLYPYPDIPLVNMKDKLEEKKYSIYKMYTTAEDFFTSIGLYEMTPKFWARSMFEKPVDRDVDCHAHASDFKYHNDYRVKICTQMDEENFYTVHHEMSHVEYYMSYDKEQPYVYQNEANPGFYEAIGDTIGLYASKF
jgi:peptidyl-dipeptidase A